MISATGTITEAGRTVGQIQLVTDEDGGRIAQLYNAKGIYLCDCPFDGDDDKGYEIGMGIYRGYVAGWMNCEVSIGKAVTQALYGKKDMEIG